MQCQEQERFHIWLALSVVFWKYLGLIYLFFLFFWNFWYHIICLGHKLWLEQAKSCKSKMASFWHDVTS